MNDLELCKYVVIVVMHIVFFLLYTLSILHTIHVHAFIFKRNLTAVSSVTGGIHIVI